MRQMSLPDPKIQALQIDELKKREAEELARLLAGKYGFPYLDLTTVAINTDALRQIEEKDAVAAKVAAFRRDQGLHAHDHAGFEDIFERTVSNRSG